MRPRGKGPAAHTTDDERQRESERGSARAERRRGSTCAHGARNEEPRCLHVKKVEHRHEHERRAPGLGDHSEHLRRRRRGRGARSAVRETNGGQCSAVQCSARDKTRELVKKIEEPLARRWSRTTSHRHLTELSRQFFGGFACREADASQCSPDVDGPSGGSSRT